VIVATPTGSTAYSFSAGGPIVEPEAKNIIITPICAHDVGSRCIMTSDKRVINVAIVKNARRNAFLSVDGGRAFKMSMGDVASITCSRLETRLIRLKDRSFYDIINNKLRHYG
jgi:NAD+ kinase